MSKIIKGFLSIILIFALVITPFGAAPYVLDASAATVTDINQPNVFLKQQTNVTCTLASAAMLMRRTAICSDMQGWEEITEENIRPFAWTNGIGLRWNFTYNNITIGHGYFSGDDNKLEILSLLEQYPQGFVIYNAYNEDQTHAVLLCDYDAENDIFYVSDPASNAPEGRIPLIESTIKGETQEDRINNIDAYWYAVSPVVSLEGDNFVAADVPSDPSDVPGDTVSFNRTKIDINSYFVVSDEATEGAALRYYPSGSSTVYKRLGKGTILFIEAKGKNNFGAEWYRTDSGYYIFSNNLTSFEEFSAEVVKFNNTAEDTKGTYTIKSSENSTVAMRLEPAEGNNIVAKLENGTKLYIVKSGVNSVGAKWLCTEDGYYIKAAYAEFTDSKKLSDTDFKGQLSSVSGEYKSEPVEDKNQAAEIEAVDYKITASALNVRASAVDGDKIGMLPNGAVVTVTAILNGWGRIEYEGREGWISLAYAEKITNVHTPVKIEHIKLSNDMIQAGSSVTCTVGLTTDVRCMYRFSVYDNKGEVHFDNTAMQTKNEYTYVADASGVYYFSIEVATADGETIHAYSGNFTVHDKLQLESVASNADDMVFVGEEIVWTVKTASTSPSAVYKYALYVDDKLVAEKESLSPTFSYIPDKAGSYSLRVYLEDNYSSSEEIASQSVKVLGELSIESITLSTDSVIAGESIVCTVEISGGKADYSYCFSVFKDDAVVRRGAYISLNSAVITLDEAGTYKVLCAVKDARASIVTDFSEDITVIAVKKGDVNNDGNVTAGDARLVLRHAASIEKLEDKYLSAADMNDDGKINSADARLVLRKAANID